MERAEIEDLLIQADAAGDTEAVQTLLGELERIEPTPTAERFMTGVTDPFFGAAQLVTRGGAALGIPGFTGITGLAQSVDDYIRQREAEYVAPDDGDFARLAGNLASPINYAIPGGAAKGALTAAKAIPQLGRTGRAIAAGTAAGAAGAAIAPAEDFEGQKGAQVAAGAALGAALGPIAERVVPAVTGAISRLRGAPSQAQIVNELQIKLQQQGVNWAALAPDEQAYLLKEVGDAVSAQAATPEQLANMQTLRRAGVETPTRAMVSQNPTQYGGEQFLANREAGAPVAAAYQQARGALGGTIESLAGRYAQALDNPEAGRQIGAVLRQAADRGDAYESALWKAARSVVGQRIPIGNANSFATNVIIDLDDAARLSALDPDIKKILYQMRGNNMPLTIRTAEQLRNALNEARLPEFAPDAKKVNGALTQVRRALDAELDRAVGLQGQARDYYNAARAAGRDRRMLERAVPALDDVRVGGKTPPDKFMQQFVTGPSVTESESIALRDFLMRSDPQAISQIKGQMLDDMLQVATGGKKGNFNAPSFDKYIRTMRKSGKLDVWFNEDEIQTLKAVAKAGRLVEGPQGVPRTGLLGAARATDYLKRMIEMMGKLPTMGRIALEPFARATEGAVERAAVTQATQNVLRTAPRVAAADIAPVGAASSLVTQD